jgi:FMN-dependent NADH-azoreductase
MITLLHLDSSAFALEASTSRTVTRAFRTAWQEANPDGTVLYRDLALDPAPHISAAAFLAGATDPATHTAEQAAAFAQRLALIEELESADAVLIGAPMYNFGIPSSLKAWLDNVILLGRTSRAEDSKISGVPVTIVSSRGGSYAPGTPMEAHEHVLNHLESVLTWILGMDPTFIVADLTLARSIPGMEELIPLGDESRARALDQAAATARDISERLAA